MYAGSSLVESIMKRTVSSEALKTLCAPSGPIGNAAASPGPSTSVPSGWRTLDVPSRTMIHSSSDS